MIRLSAKLPNKLAVAVSGGPDSMASLDFLVRNKEVTVLHYNHNTSHAEEAEKVVRKYCKDANLPLLVGHLENEVPTGVSKENFWRESRYAFFDLVTMTPGHNIPVITCHHLDDVVETWLFTSMHGAGRLIPTKRGRYLRPFLTTRKSVFEEWCDRKGVPYVIDPSNEDISFMRNYIRHEMVPRALRVNPGLHKVLRKKIENNPVIFE